MRFVLAMLLTLPLTGCVTLTSTVETNGAVCDVWRDVSWSSKDTTGTIIEVDHPTRGKYLSVGNPIKMSDSITEVTRSPLLGEHTEAVLTQLGYGAEEVAAYVSHGVLSGGAAARIAGYINTFNGSCILIVANNVSAFIKGNF